MNVNKSLFPGDIPGRCAAAYASVLYVSFTIAAISLTIGLPANAQQAPKASQHISLGAGRQLFNEYCADCHGLDGKGNGVAAEILRTPPADLTTLATRNGGKFPESLVSNAIQSKGSILAHGTPDMPMWGDVFHNLKTNQKLVAARVANLTSYVESLQEKPQGK